MKDWKQLKILITGGLGYIGSALAIELLKQNHYVSIIDNASTHPLRDYELVRRELFKYRGVEIIPDSIEHVDTRLLIGFDYIIHLAANTDIISCEENPDECLRNNYELTKKLINKMKEANLKNILFASTAAVYAMRDHCLETFELCEAEQINAYGLSKYKAEKEIIKSCLNFKILRFSNVYGTGLINKNNVINLFKQRINNNEFLELHGLGTQYRDFIHLQDAVDAIIFLMNKDVKGVFNVGSGKSTTIKTVANKLLPKQKNKIKYIDNDRVQVGIKKYDYDTTKINTLGWKTRISLDNGLKM